jgi:hypothetical protein
MDEQFALASANHELSYHGKPLLSRGLGEKMKKFFVSFEAAGRPFSHRFKLYSKTPFPCFSE